MPQVRLSECKRVLYGQESEALASLTFNPHPAWLCFSVETHQGRTFDFAAATEAEAQTFARKRAMMYIEASAKTREGIRQSFEEVVQKILDTPQLVEAVGGLSAANQIRLAGERSDAEDASYCGYC